MTLANVAWILASHGMRVLAIDWDLEGPGLHRYFHPFLCDKELSSTDGIIDFALAFESAAKAPEDRSRSDHEWFLPYANLLRYAVSLDSDVFVRPGTLDFVSAGRQDAGYTIRVNSFNWVEFYDKLGGGILLEAVKARLRQDYDYVLIDSRTGVSDTSGICTVQMPDDLVVCFTLNNQSIQGAAAAANSALRQRTAGHSGTTLRVFPIPMHIEMAERDKLETARDLVREKFDALLPHISTDDREEYWGRVEVLYEPFYAYEEVLSTFRDRPSQPKSMLASMEAITDYLSEGRVRRLGKIPEHKRTELLARYARGNSTQAQWFHRRTLEDEERSRDPSRPVSLSVGNTREGDTESQAASVAGNKHGTARGGMATKFWLGLSAAILIAVSSVLYIVLRPTPASTIHFNTDPPGTQISAGGQYCTSPCDLKLSPGSYTVDASHGGYATLQTQIKVGSHQDTFALKLSSAASSVGTLTIETNVDLADVWVDGVLKGVTEGNQATISLVPGTHDVSVQKRGYTAPAQQVEISRDHDTKLQFTLARVVESNLPTQDTYLIVRAEPGAKLTLDRTDEGEIPADGSFSIKTSPGKHRIQLTLDGFEPWSSTTTARLGDRVAINADLKRIPKPAASIVAFLSSSSSIQWGQSVQLQWETANATEVTIDQGIGNVPAKSSISVTPTVTTTYTLTVRGEGIVQRAITVNVAGLPKPMIGSFQAGADKIREGETVKLFWTTQNATEVSISPELGSVGLTGTLEVKPNHTTIYTLTAKGPGGTDTNTTMVIVESVPLVSPTSDPEVKAIQDTIQIRFKDALESMVIEEVRKVWPSMPDEVAKSLRNSFQVAKAMRVQFSCATPSVKGDSAEVACSQTIMYTINNHVQRPLTARITYQLKKNAETWYITSSSAK